MKTINLDLTKREGLTKAFTSRVADENDKLHVILTDEGKPVYMDNIKSIALKATSPKGRYFYVTGDKTEDGVTFVIPSGFNSEKGYFQNAYVEVDYNNGGVRSTQPFMYYAYGDADIKDSNTGDYISRVEELIKELNEKVDTMISNSETKISELEADITKMKADLQAFLDKFSNSRPLFFRGKMADVDWNTIKDTNQSGIYYISGITASEDKHTPVTTGQIWGQLTVKVEGVVIQEYSNGRNLYMRIYSGNPLTWSNWRKVIIEGDVYSNSEIDKMLSNVTVDAYTKKETDDKLANLSNTITTKIPKVATSDEIKAGTNNDKFVSPKGLGDIGLLSGLLNLNIDTYIGKEAQVSEVIPNGTVIGFGSTRSTLKANSNMSTYNSDKSVTINETGTYLLMAHAWFQGGSTLNGYMYFNFMKNGARAGGEDRLYGIGSDTLKNRHDGAGIYVTKLNAGDKLQVQIETNIKTGFSSAGVKALVIIKLS